MGKRDRGEKGEGSLSLKTSPASSSILRILGALSKSDSNETFSLRDSLLECILQNRKYEYFPRFISRFYHMVQQYVQYCLVPTTTV